MELYKAEFLARDLMEVHGLFEDYYDPWTFKFDNAKRRLGCCNYTRRTISISKPLVLINDEATVRDTILHEIAHALTPGAKHGPQWKTKCREIGAKPERCATDAEEVEAAWEGTCPECERVYKRHRLSKGIREKSQCHCITGPDRYDLTKTLKWKKVR